MPQLPPLPSLRVFDAVVRHMSFTKAAVELAMTQSAVSYQIKTLEAFIGEALFSRQARSIALTPRGATLAPIVRQSLATLAAAFAAARDQAAGLLVISTFMTFATNWLASRIGGFQLANSDLAVRLDVSNDLIDLAVGQADVAIRSGFGTWEGLRSHYLFRSRFAPFCSPSFIDKHGPIEKAADMVRLPLIAPDDEWWPIWFAAANAGAVVPPQQRGLITDRQPVIASAAIGGHGIGLLTRATSPTISRRADWCSCSTRSAMTGDRFFSFIQNTSARVPKSGRSVTGFWPRPSRWSMSNGEGASTERAGIPKDAGFAGLP